MNNFRMALTPEAYTLWVMAPEVLLLADQLVMDKRDYETVKRKVGRSKMDYQIATLLEKFADEEFVEFKEYDDLIPCSIRSNIHELAESMVNELSPKQKMELSEHAYREFRSYLRAKLVHLRPGEPLFNETAEALRETEDRFRRIKEGNLITDTNLDNHIKFILGRITAKWIAGEIICQKMDVHALHDTDEYRPFAKLIRKKFASTKEGIIPLFLNDYNVPLNMLWQALRLAFDTPRLITPDDLRKFKLARAEVQIIRDVFREILTYYQEVKDTSLLEANVEHRIKESKDFIERELKKLPVRILSVLPAVVEFALSLFGISVPARPVEGQIHKLSVKYPVKRISKKSVDPFVRLCCFSIYAERATLLPMEPKLSSTCDSMEETAQHWILRPALPWYERANERNEEKR